MKEFITKPNFSLFNHLSNYSNDKIGCLIIVFIIILVGYVFLLVSQSSCLKLLEVARFGDTPDTHCSPFWSRFKIEVLSVELRLAKIWKKYYHIWIHHA